VDAVITTHLHWDHAGGLNGARAWEARADFQEGAALHPAEEWIFALHPDQRSEVGLLPRRLHALADGNQVVELLDRDTEVLPGVHVRHVGVAYTWEPGRLFRSGELACAVTGGPCCRRLI